MLTKNSFRCTGVHVSARTLVTLDRIFVRVSNPILLSFVMYNGGASQFFFVDYLLVNVVFPFNDSLSSLYENEISIFWLPCRLARPHLWTIYYHSISEHIKSCWICVHLYDLDFWIINSSNFANRLVNMWLSLLSIGFQHSRNWITQITVRLNVTPLFALYWYTHIHRFILLIEVQAKFARYSLTEEALDTVLISNLNFYFLYCRLDALTKNKYTHTRW